MPAEVESYAGRKPAWHGIGVDVGHLMNAKEALKEASLNWKVTKEPLVVPERLPEDTDGKIVVEGLLVPNHFAVTRSRDHKVLGIVGKPYVPLQNEEAFEFMDAMVDSGEAKYETAGALKGGKWVFITMKMPEGILVGGEDPIDLYLALFNSHDGTKAITGMVTPVRIVCSNTLNLALRNSKRQWTVRHLGNMQGQLSEARRQLELTFEYAEKFGEQMDELAQKKFTDNQFEALVEKLTDAESVAEGLKESWTGGPERGTHSRSNRWDALNAVGEYGDWLRDPRTDNSRIVGSWFGEGRHLRDAALKELMPA